MLVYHGELITAPKLSSSRTLTCSLQWSDPTSIALHTNFMLCTISSTLPSFDGTGRLSGDQRPFTVTSYDHKCLTVVRFTSVVQDDVEAPQLCNLPPVSQTVSPTETLNPLSPISRAKDVQNCKDLSCCIHDKLQRLQQNSWSPSSTSALVLYLLLFKCVHVLN